MPAGSVDGLLREREALYAQIEALHQRVEAIQREIETLTLAPVAPVVLSSRQRQVLEGIMREWTNKEIASTMNIGERTVKFHMSQMLHKLTKHYNLPILNRRDLMLIARRFALLACLLITLFVLAAAPLAHAQQGPPSAGMSWTGVTVPTQSALSYKVQRATVQAGPFTTIQTGTATTFTDTGVVRGSTYFWRVLASCPTTGAGCGTVASPVNGDSAPSNVITGTIPNTTVTPPAITTLSLDSVQ